MLTPSTSTTASSSSSSRRRRLGSPVSRSCSAWCARFSISRRSWAKSARSPSAIDVAGQQAEQLGLALAEAETEAPLGSGHHQRPADVAGGVGDRSGEARPARQLAQPRRAGADGDHPGHAVGHEQGDVGGEHLGVEGVDRERHGASAPPGWPAASSVTGPSRQARRCRRGRECTFSMTDWARWRSGRRTARPRRRSALTIARRASRSATGRRGGWSRGT